MNLALSLPSYSRSSRPITSCTDHLVAICSSLHLLPCFLCLRSVVYTPHNLSNRSFDSATSSPDTRSSQYNRLIALYNPALPVPTDVNSSVSNLCRLSISILQSLALVLVTDKPENTSLHKYSPDGSRIRKHSS